MRNVLGRLVEAIQAIATSMEASGLTYAFGGALALSAWAEPRATRDIDLNVWVDPADITEAVSALEQAGVAFDHATAAKEARERGMFVGFLDEYRVDVFVPSIPFYAEARRRILDIPFLGIDMPVLSPETLAVFKLLFYRPKDLVDLQRLLEVRGSDFDTAFVRSTVAQMMGEEDSRIEAWDHLVEAACGSQ